MKDQEKLSYLSLYLGICIGFISNHNLTPKLKQEHPAVYEGIYIVLYNQQPRIIFNFEYAPIYQQDAYEILLTQNRNGPKPRRMAVCEREDDAKEIVAALKFAHQNNVI